MTHTQIVIFGTGEQAMRAYYVLREEYEIMYFLDNSRSGQYFYGKKTEAPNEENTAQYYIVVCTNMKNYVEIAKQLKTYGLAELKDFCHMEAFGKKIVVVHGNCHMRILKAYMTTSEIFCAQYYLYPLPPIQDIKRGYIEDDVLENCDVFIHQDIRKENHYGEKLSDEYIMPRLGRGVKKITVPNLYNFEMAFFPQTVMNKNNPKFNDNGNGLFRHGDRNVEELLDKGITNLEEILNVIRGGVYDAEYIRAEFEKYTKAALERELCWDVKIMDYILKNYKDKRLFYDYGHPYNDVIKEICAGVFKIMGLDEKTIKEIDINLGTQEEPVYPCVIQALGMKWDNGNLRRNGYKLISGEMDFKEYYREYLYWSYGI